MGVDLSQYRSRIGTFVLNIKMGPRARTRKRKRMKKEEKTRKKKARMRRRN